MRASCCSNNFVEWWSWGFWLILVGKRHQLKRKLILQWNLLFRVPILMIDSIVYGSDRKNFTCSPSSREQEANIIRRYAILFSFFFKHQTPPAVQQLYHLFVFSFIECEWTAKMNECPSPHFTSKTMPVLYPKVLKSLVFFLRVVISRCIFQGKINAKVSKCR